MPHPGDYQSVPLLQNNLNPALRASKDSKSTKKIFEHILTIESQPESKFRLAVPSNKIDSESEKVSGHIGSNGGDLTAISKSTVPIMGMLEFMNAMPVKYEGEGGRLGDLDY